MNFWLHLKKLDWALILSIVLLSVIGLIQISSTTYKEQGLFFFKKQLISLALGFALMVFLSLVDYRILRNYSSLLASLYLVGLILLVLVLFGAQTRGIKGWLKIGKLYFQPVEYIKVLLIFILAKYFSWRHIEMFRARHIFVSGLYVFLPASLVLLQPDLGSFFVLAIIWIGLVIVTGIKLRHLLIVMLIAMILAAAGWFGLLQEYQKQRILTFLNPQRDPLGSSYNIRQSLIAIGSGGFFGKGIGQGSQSQLGFLPEDYSDFIFASFAEEWGLAGVLVLLSLYVFLFYRLFKAACLAKNNFSCLVPAGLALLFLVQIFINIGSVTRILPITGITLPFVSYGGSNLVMNFVGLGILQSIIARSKA